MALAPPPRLEHVDQQQRTLSGEEQLRSWTLSTWVVLKSSLVFYRIHLLFFTAVPLLAATVFWASNGEFRISFVDALFVCISAATGTGLTPIDLSSTTPWQQAILVLLEFCGNISFVAWVVVYIRRSFFIDQLKPIVSAERERDVSSHESTQSRNSQGSPSRPIADALTRGLKTTQEKRRFAKLSPSHSRVSGDSPRRVRVDMIQRLEDPPQRIDPVGNALHHIHTSGFNPSPSVQSPRANGFPRIRSMESRTQTHSEQRMPLHDEAGYLGGFPYPWRILVSITSRFFPRLHQRLRRTVTMPRSSTLVPPSADATATLSGDGTRQVPYISFSASVGRNSAFRDLSEENLEELGGVEYRALTALLWIVPLYYVGLLTISFIIIAPYANLRCWRWIFQRPEQHRTINPTWFSAFQVMGAWANTGMSLVDQNMVPFRTGYPMIIVLVGDVLAGNTAMPIFLRFMIWILTKLFPRNSRTKEALHFLLDHPRRCFIYLFPANQTWVLLTVQFLIDFILWFFNIVLNIGNPETDMVPVGVRVVDALLQAAAVRSAGFQTISTSTLVPAVQVLDVVMMYVAIYPIALSVRATNVYEETSLGIYETHEEIDEMEDTAETRVAIWGKYLWRHARRQLSFDMWWLALSLFLLCIIERAALMDTSKATWFNIFSIIFELVSAYGTVGLSLGVPYANYSFCGAFHTLSKLILCAVMIRGRHRGLPVALDRAVLLPHEFKKSTTHTADDDSHAPAEGHNLDQEKSTMQGDRPETNGRDEAMDKHSEHTLHPTPRPRTLSFAVDERNEIRKNRSFGIGDVREDVHDIQEILRTP